MLSKSVLGLMMLLLMNLLASCSIQSGGKIVYELSKNFDNLNRLQIEDREHWKVIDDNLVFAAATGDTAWKKATLALDIRDYQIDAVINVSEDAAKANEIKNFFAADADLNVSEDTTLDRSAGIIFRKDAASMRMAVFYVSKPCNGWAASGALCEDSRFLTEIFKFSGKETFKGLSLDKRNGFHHLRLIVKGNIANFYVDEELCCIMDVSGFSGNEVGFYGRYQMSLISFSIRELPCGVRIYEKRPVPNLLAEGKICPIAVRWQNVIDEAAKKIDKAVALGSPDVPGMEHLPNYVYRCATWMPAGGKFLAYPAFHHSIIMNGLLEYYTYTDNKKYFDLAVQLADWEIEHSTPADCKVPYLPYSTTMDGKMGGYVDGNTVMPDKAGHMGSTYLRLYKLTDNLKYKEATIRIGDTLLTIQLPEGRWQGRISYNNGSVSQDYTSNQIFNIILMDELYRQTGDHRYAESSRRALQWLMKNPVRTWRWIGFYEDVLPETESVGNCDAIESARYLIAHRNENPEYMKVAKDITDWIAAAFCFRQGGLWPVVCEQSLCLYAMNGTTLWYAHLLSDMYQATGDKYYRDTAISATNAGLSMQYDGWYSMIFCPATQGLPLVRELDIK